MSVQQVHIQDAKPLRLSSPLPRASMVAPKRRRTLNVAPGRGDGSHDAGTELVATIAHELRSPLATLQVTLELLADFADLDPADVKELVGRLQRGVTWMNGLIDNLATWAAISDGRLALRRETVTVREWIDPAMILSEPILARRGQQVRLSCPAPAPVVSGDTLRLGQVLVNLLTNAGRYGAWADVIDLTVTVEHAHVWIRVTDHGGGIPPDYLERILERYVRGDGAERAALDGQGLGLHIVRRLVELHGGAVGVESVPGAGATFWFSLPMPPVAPGDAERGAIE